MRSFVSLFTGEAGVCRTAGCVGGRRWILRMRLGSSSQNQYPHYSDCSGVLLFLISALANAEEAVKCPILGPLRRKYAFCTVI